MNVDTLSPEQIKKIYLDWINNFITSQGFADHYSIPQNKVFSFLEKAKQIFEKEN